MPYGISCDLSGLCSQRLASRVPARMGILPGLAAAEGRLDLYCDGRSIPVDLVGVSQLLLFVNSSFWIICKCTQITATGRGHYSSRLMLSLCVHFSRLRPNQTLVN
jgi:hypothetical protein